jgi:3-hydroxyacyl-CoA dehydrogenase/enoyl-CoA hydratase/3-hydroxybutyryl-CoA epimerase/enoyl-CoA isomerase
VIEAVVESLAVKHALFAQLERLVAPDTVLASNTSSLRIDDIAGPMQRPEQLVGMHFFNPVPAMPLVEIIKGSRTSAAAIATAVAHALKMGKKPIVVTDCPGFLVNRVITPYLRSFLLLVAEGCSFEKIDRVMEAFGWPMGPAYLEDVVGMDTGSHVLDVIREGYGERMPKYEDDALKLLVRLGRLGQKSGLGFYRHAPDDKGRLVKTVEPGTHELLAALQRSPASGHEDAVIVERMMLPMLIEAARALEEGVVGSAEELDLALTLGIGFPAYLGGALKYADWLGMKAVQEMSRRHAQLGPEYVLTGRMAHMARDGSRYYA